MPLFRRNRSKNGRSSRKIYVAHNIPPEEVVIPEKFPNNRIETSKYTLWNFIPKNFFEQFRRIANFYFLCIAMIQLSINSPVSPATSLTPLIFVVIVTAAKQAYEDWLRHRADNSVNNVPYLVYSHGEMISVKSEDIKVGDIVMIKADEEVPCDLILLSSSDEQGKCHITTANLDGETNLKVHECLPCTKQYQTPESFSDIFAVVECEEPTPDLYRFIGRMSVLFDDGSKTVCSLGPVNLLLKGASLKNTHFVYGVAIYTGQDTKMALNLRLTSNKFSTVEKSMNKFLIAFLVILLCEATVGTMFLIFYNEDDIVGRAWYIPQETRTSVNAVVEDFLSFAVLFNYIIPISLYVTLEMVKFIGSKFFIWDNELYDETSNEAACCNSSDLNEELGQVQYLFTDKTGTLTENDMCFRQCSINGINYIECNAKLSMVKDIQPSTPEPLGTLPNEVEHFFLVLALCNTVQINKDTSTSTENCASTSINDTRLHSQCTEYQASSPDEKALVEACRRFGIVLHDVFNNNYTIITKHGTRRYKKLHTLEFDSDRKRMSTIVQDERGYISLLCKGAESTVLGRITSGPKNITSDHLNNFAMAGLRTLIIAEKNMSESEYKKFDEELQEARNQLEHREESVSRVFEMVEQNLHMLGATAVEDRLQDGVGITLESLRAAGIKIWVLTGDKKETAENVSLSCGHFKRGMVQLSVIEQSSSDECYYTLQHQHNRILQEPFSSYSLIIDGCSLEYAIKDHRDIFISVSKQCSAVLCCRMSPLQKAEIVKLIKHSPGKPVTAAIGDGANDVSMIQEAHVGLGIMGKEGRQAVRCSDFAFAKFRFLPRVLLVHGQYYYTRVSILVQYFFYKNIAFIIPQFLYIFFNGFTPQPVYNSIFLMFYNIFFTSLPIFIFGFSEKHACEEDLMAHPELYRTISKNSRLTIGQFVKWVLQGLWHAFVFFFGVYYLWRDSPLLAQSGENKESYYTVQSTVEANTLAISTYVTANLGIWSFGTVMFHVLVLTVNLKLALHVKYWTVLFTSSMIISIVGFIAFTLFYTGIYWSVDTSILYWVYIMVLSSTEVWFGTVVFILMALLPDIVLILLERHSNHIKKAILNVPYLPSETTPLIHCSSTIC